MSLPEALVGTWAGFVFINMDRNAVPLDEVLGPIKAHFERYENDKRYISYHIEKVVGCNWKTAAEAFMESHHAITTHPQALPFLADLNSQYDILTDHITRQFSASMVPSPYNVRSFSEQEILDASMGSLVRSADDGVPTEQAFTVPEGVTARAYMANFMRDMLAAEDGHDYSAAADAELLDSLLYNVFPHMSFWAGFQPNLIYRWRPNGHDHSTSIMDIYVLKYVPKGAPRPKPASVFRIGLDESMLELAPSCGMSPLLAAVFEQDMLNFPHIQSGMAASATGVLNFGRYAEMRIRKMHLMLDQVIAEGREKEAATK